MFKKRQFGIKRNEGFLSTLFQNDWLHSILVNKHVPGEYRDVAKVLIAGQVFSATAAVYNAGQMNTVASTSSVVALVYSLMSLSNATKNRRDSFSSFIQSYFSKCHNAIYMTLLCIYGTMSASVNQFLTLYTTLLVIDAALGLFLFYQIFKYENSN